MTKPTVLPADVRRLLSAVGLRLHNGESVRTEIHPAIAALSKLPPTTISQAARAIADIAKLHRWRPERPFFESLFRRRLSDKEQLLQLPQLAYLFLFHSDGRTREAALQRISGGLPSPFLYTAVAYRLNDWAEPVRAAAFACAQRCFPLTAPEVIAAAAEALLLRQDSWGRWGKEREVIDAAFGRPDVASSLASLLCQARTGPASRILRSVLKRDAMDQHLQTLAAEAAQPPVRALAVQALATGKATWVAGTEWKWIDKSMGRRLRVPGYESRELSPIADPARVIELAARDRSAVVRRTALAALIGDYLDTEQAKAIATQLQADTSPSVRERAQFVLCKRKQT